MAEFSRALSVCNHSSLLKSDIFGLTTVGFYLSQIYFGEYLDLTQVVSTVVAFILYLVISFFIATLFRSSRILCEKFDNLKRFFFEYFVKNILFLFFEKKVENLIFELLSPTHKEKTFTSGLLVTNGHLVKTQAFSHNDH